MAQAFDQPNSRHPSLLLAEDDRLLRDSLARFLEARGYAVWVATSVAEGRALLADAAAADAPFDAAVLDVRLPDGEGLDLVEQLGAERVLVISAHPEPARYAALGVRNHLGKPFDLDVLARRMEALVVSAARTPEAAP